MSATLSGELAQWPLGDLMFWLFQSGQTGVVRIETDHQAGSLQFLEGRLIFASVSPKGANDVSTLSIAEDAVVALLQIGHGQFNFVADTLAHTAVNISLTTEDLLISLPFIMEDLPILQVVGEGANPKLLHNTMTPWRTVA